MTPDSLESTQFALREFIFDGCDQAMAEAICAFADSLTTRHSLTSRRPSFWALVRRSLDGPVIEALSRSAIPVVPELAAFVPSKLGSTTPPGQYADSDSPYPQPQPQPQPQQNFALENFVFDGCDHVNVNDTSVLANSPTTRHSITSRRSSPWALVRSSLDLPVVAALSRNAIPVMPELAASAPSKLESIPPPGQSTASDSRESQPRPGKMPASKDQIENLYLWQIFVRHAARLYIARRGDAYTPEDQKALATLDTLRNVAFAIGIPKPVTATTTLECSGQPVRRRAVNYPPALFQHCDLCWRSAMHSAAQQWFPRRLSVNDYSLRFCVYHVPLEDPPPFNRYRTDIRYRSVFQKEIVLRNQELCGHRALSLIPPVKGTPAEWRKAAYDIVHSAMQPTKRNARSSTGCTLSNVFKHQQQGYSQKEIADALSVSKQAVSAAVSRLREIKTFHENEADIDFITEEPFALDQEATWHLFDKVRRLRASGQSTAQISRTVGRFKYTVQAIERWIGVVDELRQRPHSTDTDEAARCFVAPAAVQLIRKRLRQPE